MREVSHSLQKSRQTNMKSEVTLLLVIAISFVSGTMYLHPVNKVIYIFFQIRLFQQIREILHIKEYLIEIFTTVFISLNCFTCADGC